MIKPLQSVLSPEDYLEMEKSSEERHEFLSGYMYAMAGASQRHSRIVGNIFATLWQTALNKSCRVHQADMKLRVETSAFYYPDVMVVCDKEEPDPYFETEPCILVEVLSPSTKHIDVREKMLEYKRLPSLQTYLIVDLDSLFVRHLWRDDAGEWQQQDTTGSGTLDMPCLGATLKLSQIYRGVF
ncbi:Uma2 family endonuclease [soil metagenome]